MSEETESRYMDMDPGDMLTAVADDATKWAQAFGEVFPEIDRELMVAWFANAIENTWDVRCSRLTRSDQAWASFSAQVEHHRALWKELANQDTPSQ